MVQCFGVMAKGMLVTHQWALGGQRLHCVMDCSFSHCAPQRAGWGCTKCWKGTQPGHKLVKGSFHTT